MHSLRKWLYKPKKEDTSKLAMFYRADEEMMMITTELDSFDGRTDPERCSILVTQLRFCQDKVLSICNEIMDEAIPDMRANRDFRAKFPDDVLHENLGGQLWFGAECLAAGSNIIHREVESATLRPLAMAFTRTIENVRCLLREQALRNVQEYTQKVKDSLRIFDRLFAEFEFSYVRIMVPVKSTKEYHLQQEIVVLFSETLIRGLELGLINQEMVDDYDPSLMFTIPRLAIVWGLLIFTDGPFNVDRDAEDMSELFSPFCSLLQKIRDLLWTLTRSELTTLEKMLCSQEEPKIEEKVNKQEIVFPSTEDFVNSKLVQTQLYTKQFVQDFYAYNFGMTVDEAGNQTAASGENRLTPRTKDSLKSPKSGSKSRRALHNLSADCLESDISGLVSPSFGTPNSAGSLTNISISNAQDGENEDLGNLNVTLASNIENSSAQRIGNTRTRKLSPSKAMSSKYRHQCLCSNVENVAPTVSSNGILRVESHLSQLRSQCNCQFKAKHSPKKRHRASRAATNNVMHGIEIIPPHGMQTSSYHSSAESSPKTMRPVSQSYPVHYAGTRGSSEALYVPTVSSLQRRYGSPQLSRSHGRDCDIAKLRFSDCDNCGSPTGSFENLSSWFGFTTPLPIPRLRKLEGRNCDATYSSCSSCQSISSESCTDFNSTSPETSSYNSDCRDDEEIALALQAAEIASRNNARTRFKNSGDLLHKLFVCISGVADQLQTNFASDLRNILKSVFDMNCTQSPVELIAVMESSAQEDGDLGEQPQGSEGGTGQALPTTVHLDFPVDLFTDPVLSVHDLDDDDRDRSSVDSAEEAMPDSPTSLVLANNENQSRFNLGPPTWLPDEFSSDCMSCELPFTILRRRHHCRNCGKIFCSRCSSNLIPLPQFGHLKPVRVCNQCFVYHLTSLVMQSTNA